MEYFLLKQDDRYSDTPVLREVMQKVDLRHLNRLGAHRLPDTMVFQVRADVDTCFLDILDQQLYLVSDKLKPILEMYAPETLFKTVPLIDQKQRRQLNYYLPIFEEVDALSPSSELNLNRSVIKKLVLREEKLIGKRIAVIGESEKPLVVIRLDVAESILRRELTGICLEKVSLD